MDLSRLNPITSTPHLVVFFLLFAAGVLWLAWRSSIRARPSARGLILGCRGLLLLGLLWLALNPGGWNEQREETENFWTILVDRSGSMATPDADPGGGDRTRWSEATRLAERARDLSRNPDGVSVRSFTGGLERGENELDRMAPDGTASDLVASGDALLNEAKARPGRYTGTLVITDGRQTVEDPGEAGRVGLRARAGEAPFHVLPIGGEVAPIDLELRSTRRQFVGFAGQEVTVSARIVSSGLGALRAEIILEDAEGIPVGEGRQVDLAEGGSEAEVRFSLPAPEPGAYLYRFRTPVREGERITANNRDSFTLSVLEGETRIFMAEGAPYWDSKFLAQMIRKRENMRITSVYRLAADRFFRVETGDARPSEAVGDVFPATAGELAAYDLVVFGKGAEYFLDPERLGLLSEYVRDRGGAVLFTRGKPYSARFEGLEFLEPVSWGEKVGEPFRLRPTAEGEAAGLFGDLLPGVEDPVWDQLPELAEAHQALEVKPFTEVLLEGEWQLDGKARRIPILMSRRFGRGLVAMLNADGLWKWDFFPEEAGVEGKYEEFWTQLIQWAITYSEFLPGQDLSLHLDRALVYPGEPVRARIGHRGAGRGEDEATGDANPPMPALRWTSEDGRRTATVTASRPGPQATRWEAALTLDEPGEYRVEAFDTGDPRKPGPSLSLTVLSPPSERDQLSADPGFAASFAENSGGRLLEESDLEEIVAQLDGGAEKVDRAKAVWDPIWDRAWVFAFLLGFASLEWFTRRRSGLL